MYYFVVQMLERLRSYGIVTIGIVALLSACAMALPMTAAAESGTWSTPTPINASYNLQSVACVSAEFCFAGGDQPSVGVGIFFYNGVAWGGANVLSTITQEIPALSCASAAFCVAVSNFGAGAFTYTGSWSGSSATGVTEARAVSCPATGFCVAAGGDNFFENVGVYKEGSWNHASIDQRECLHLTTVPCRLTGVSCPATSFCVATDQYGDALTYNGTTWSEPRNIDPAVLENGTWLVVSCSSAEFCAAVDRAGNTMTYNGSGWSAPASSDSGAELLAVSCPSNKFCIATDNKGNALTYNGSSWSAPRSIDSGNKLIAVSCPSAEFCAAVDSPGNALFYRATSAQSPPEQTPEKSHSPPEQKPEQPYQPQPESQTGVGKAKINGETITLPAHCAETGCVFKAEVVNATKGEGGKTAETATRKHPSKPVVVVYATKTVKLVRGQSTTLRLQLNARGRRLLRANGKLRAELVVREGKKVLREEIVVFKLKKHHR